MDNPRAYNEDSIRSMNKIEHIRNIPTGYIKDTGQDGIFHIVREIIDNSLDELDNFTTNNSELQVLLFTDIQEGRMIFITRDTGRGIPGGWIEDIYTKDMVSGKFDQKAYRVSSGLYGVGSTVSYALSDAFRAISYRKEGITDCLLKPMNSTKHIQNKSNSSNRTGTTVIMSPDPKIFIERTEFIQEGYNKIVKLFQIIGHFNPYRLTFWKKDLDSIQFNNLYKQLFTINQHDNTASLKQEDVDAFINTNLNIKEHLIYDSKSTLVQDIDKIFANYFGLQQLPNTRITIDKGFTSKDDKLTFQIEIFPVVKNFDITKCVISAINNVIFTGLQDIHIRILRNVLKTKISKLLPKQDKNMIEFFKKKYVLPCCYLINIKFSGARFTGLTKSEFNDKIFAKDFQHALNDRITTEISKTLFDIIEKDFITKYNSQLEIKVTTNNKRMPKLNHPKNFSDCQEYGPDSELFICEGGSAKSNQSRDSRFQALYSLKGVPCNAVNKTNSLKVIATNSIFQDIFTILGITPGMKDFSNVRFGKIFISTDADEYGQEIANLILGNLHIYNPKILQKKMVYIVIPPLYKLQFKDGTKLHIRTKKEFHGTLAMLLYRPNMDILVKPIETVKVGIEDKITKPIKLRKDEFCGLVDSIMTFYEEISDKAKNLNVSPNILEALVRNFDVIYNINSCSNELLQRAFRVDHIKYDKKENILLISYKENDVFIPLHGIKEMILGELLPLWQQFHFDKVNFMVRPKKKYGSNFLMNMTPVQLAQLFESINGKITIKKLKGIGGMENEDKIYTCMDPKTRFSYQISNVKDVENIYRYLGIDNKYRKELVTIQL